MQYSRLIWRHTSPTEPIEIMSEYDQDGWERRKIEVFADDSVGCASRTESLGGSKLSLIQRPPDDEVVDEPEFRVAEMTKSEFEAAWKQAHSTLTSIHA